MSERGSFVTEYIYCPECEKALALILLDENSDFRAIRIPNTRAQGKTEPIFAGRVSGLYSGEEIDVFRGLREQIEEGICHPVRIAILPETRGEVSLMTFKPRKGNR